MLVGRRHITRNDFVGSETSSLIAVAIPSTHRQTHYIHSTTGVSGQCRSGRCTLCFCISLCIMRLSALHLHFDLLSINLLNFYASTIVMECICASCTFEFSLCESNATNHVLAHEQWTNSAFSVCLCWMPTAELIRNYGAGAERIKAHQSLPVMVQLCVCQQNGKMQYARNNSIMPTASSLLFFFFFINWRDGCIVVSLLIWFAVKINMCYCSTMWQM